MIEAICPCCKRQIHGWIIKYAEKITCPYEDCKAPLKRSEKEEEAA